jgi:steroid delta-isomerase-like uncharacterized protein
MACLLAALTAAILAALGAGLTQAGSSPPTNHDWEADANAAIARRFYAEAWSKGDLAAVPEIIAVDHVYHDANLRGVKGGPDGVAQVVTDLRRAFPDLTVSVDDLVATQDRVLVRFTARGTHLGPILGANGHGEEVTVTGTAVYRMADRQIAETWVTWDVFGLAEQLGLYLLSVPTDGSWEAPPGRTHPEGPR